MNVTRMSLTVLSGAMVGLTVAMPSVAAAQGGPGQAVDPPAGFLEIIFAGGVIGILMIVVLLALSLTTAYLVFDHLMTIRKSILIPELSLIHI